MADEDGTFGFDITDQARPRLVLGGPGDPRPGHWRCCGALTAPARGRGWPHRGAPVGFYVSTEASGARTSRPSTARPWGRVAETLSG